MEEIRNESNILVRKTEGKRTLGKLGIEGKILLE
jgi:hypothetical protein